MTRSRECEDGRVGDLGCVGPTQEARECYGARRQCEFWGPWESWHPCSVTCGQGVTTRTRPCMNGRPGDQGCPGSATESDTCEMSACEVFVDYGDEPDTDFESICPEIKQDYTYEREYIVEFVEDNEPVRPTQPPAQDDNEDFDDSCDAILNQNARTCSKMFTDSCMSCDTSLERVCPKSHALREELNQLQSDMVTCQQKIDHYSAQVMKINGEVFKLHEQIKTNFEWVNTVTQKMINNAADPTEGYISPCVINEVTVKTEFDESVVNIHADLLISPYATINLDVDIRGDCCSSKGSMIETRKELGAALTNHIKRLVERTSEQ